MTDAELNIKHASPFFRVDDGLECTNGFDGCQGSGLRDVNALEGKDFCTITTAKALLFRNWLQNRSIAQIRARFGKKVRLAIPIR
jgi:hypothetical protein